MNKTSPIISVIIPVYNANEYLQEAISSILNQSFKDFEVICCDDCSTDNTYDLLLDIAKNDSRVKVIQNEQNQGVAKTLNNCLKHVSKQAKYIARMDADDISLPSRLQTQFDFMEKNHDIDICGSAIETFGITNNIITHPTDHKDIVVNLYQKNWALNHPTVIIRKSFIEKHDLSYDPNSIAEDFDLWIRSVALHDAKLANTAEVLLKYRVSANQVTKQKADILRKDAERIKELYPYGIHIFFASDDNYAPALLTSITSMLENTQEFVNIYVLDSNISKKSKRKIKKCLKKYSNFSLEYLTIDTDFIKSSFPEGEFYVSYATYNRLFISKLKPNLKKVIYSDVDIIFTGDVAVLNNEDLEGHTLGVVEDAIYLINDNLNNYQGRLNLPKSHNYFYAGMLLIDNQKWIEENITEKSLQLAKEKADDLLQGDQDILNILFENNYKKLSPKYEATHGYVDNADKFSDEVQEDLKLENVIIRHYEGSVKPWHSYSIKDSNLFWEQAKNTPFYKSLIFSLYKNKICKIALSSIISLIPIKKVRKQYRQKLKKVYS